MHLVESDGVLSKELEDFINEAEDGFIYVSFGSIITISTIPSNVLQTFFEALGSFSGIRFLWKWEGELPKGSPENILFKPWFPQNDVLAHKKIMGFISQGGQVSMQQAIFHGVPLIIMPVNGDQTFNAKRAKKVGNGIELEFHGITVKILKDAIQNLTQDKKYKNYFNL